MQFNLLESKPIKVVLDSNVILSGLLWQGLTKAVFDLIEQDKIVICLTPAILQEVKRTLTYPRIKKQLDFVDLSVDEIIDSLVEKAELYEDISLVNISRDADDNKFLDCALLSNAEYIISGDKDLLDLKNFLEIPILKPNEFLAKIDER